MHNITKEFSIALITHAVAKLRFEGKPEKEIAELLGIDASNIPKYKSGESKLSQTSIKLLLETYGAPRMAEGRYCLADVHPTVDDYIQAYDKKISMEFFRQIAPLMQSRAFQKELAAKISDRVLQVAPDDTPMFRMSTYVPSNVNGVLDWFISQLPTEGFRKWLQKFEADISQNKRPPLLRSFVDSWQETLVTEYLDTLIYTLARLVAPKSKKVSSWDELFVASHQDDRSEVVLTGDVVLEFSIQKPTHAMPKFIEIYCQRGKQDDDISLLDDQLEENLRSLTSFSVKSVQIRVFLNERMQYRILIDEQVLDSKRVMVIRDVRADHIVDEVNKLASFYKADSLPEFEFKTAIAARGGYIAGAEVL
jgi:hypothetical protein